VSHQVDVDLDQVKKRAEAQAGSRRKPVAGRTTSKTYLDQIGTMISGREVRQDPHIVAGHPELSRREIAAYEEQQKAGAIDPRELEKLKQDAYDARYSTALAHTKDEAEAKSQAEKARDAAERAFLNKVTKGYNGGEADLLDPNFGTRNTKPNERDASLSGIERHFERAGNPNTRRMISTVQRNWAATRCPRKNASLSVVCSARAAMNSGAPWIWSSRSPRPPNIAAA